MEPPLGYLDRESTVKSLLVRNLIMAVCNLLLLAFVVPGFGDMFADFGHTLPIPTKFVWGISRVLLAHHGLGFAILVFNFIVGSGWILKKTRDVGSHKELIRLGLQVTLAVLCVIPVMVVWAIFRPIFDRGGVVSG